MTLVGDPGNRWRRFAGVGLLLGVAAGAAAAAESPWTELPADLVPGAKGRVRIREAGQPLPLELPSKPAWGDGILERQSTPTFRLRLEQGTAEKPGALVGLYLPAAGAGPLEVECEVDYAGAGGAWPVRFAAREAHEPVFLTVGPAGDSAATGWLDPATGRGADFAAIHPRLQLELRANAARTARTARVSGRIPKGREVVIFSSRPVALGHRWPRNDRLDLGKDAAWLSGWTFPGAGEVEKRVKAATGKLRLDHGTYLELGDGWQGKKGSGPFARSPRDWHAALGSVSSRGGPAGAAGDAPASDLTSQIDRVRSLGLLPGVWIVPHGQDDGSIAERLPQAFITQKKLAAEAGGSNALAGKAASAKKVAVSDRFLGKYIVDGTSAAGLEYLRDLLAQLRRQGAKVLRLGGLRDALELYQRERESLADPAREPLAVLEATVAAMREGAGEDIWLLGDWDTPPELAGLDGARPRFDASLGVDPLRQELAAAAAGYALHRWRWWQECFPISRWSDAPDLTDRREQDRARLVFAALTGRGVIVDRSETPPAWANEQLALVGPPAPVRPLSLDAVGGIPPTWVLRLDAGEPRGDLIGVFNATGWKAETASIDPARWGCADAGGGFLLYDVLEEKLIGIGPGPWDLSLLPSRARLVWLAAERGQPAILGLSTRLLAVADGLDNVRWDERRLELSGSVKAVAWTGESTEARLAIYTAGHSVIGASAGAEPLQFEAGGLILALRLKKPAQGDSPFRVLFAPPGKPREAGSEKLPPPTGLRVTHCESERRPLLEWGHGAQDPAAARRTQGFQVLRDGLILGKTTGLSFLDTTARAGEKHVYSVEALPGGEPSSEAMFNVPRRQEVYLDALSVEGYSQGVGTPARRRSVTGGPLSVAGRKFERGLGVRVPSRLDYRLDGDFARLEVFLGVDDAARFRGSVELVVIVDDKERYRSPVIRGGGREPQKIVVPIAGGRILSLVAEGGKDGTEDDLADWCDAKVITE